MSGDKVSDENNSQSMSLGLSRSLRSLVADKFNSARDAGDVVFSNTKLAVLKTSAGPAFQLRFLPNLAKKPIDNKPVAKDTSPPKRKFDPFDNPSEKLLVANITHSNHTHNLVLNKFPIIPNHFILATKDNKPQDFPLEIDDLALTYECVKAWRKDTTGLEGNHPPSLFAFFNSGPESGASQPHRHVQFVPVEDMKSNDNSNDSNTWPILAETMTTPYNSTDAVQDLLHNPTLPFVHFATRLDPSISPKDLHDKYIHLLRTAYFALTHDSLPTSTEQIEDTQPTRSEGQVLFSYNLCLTDTIMAIVPRLHGDVEDAALFPPDQGAISANGTMLAGTFLVKSEAQFDKLRASPDMVLDLLRRFAKGTGDGGLGGEGKAHMQQSVVGTQRL